MPQAQPNRSQSFNNFAQPQLQNQQPQWRPMWQQNQPNHAPPIQAQQQNKPDLSAFDSLLPTSSNSNNSRVPMNSLMTSTSNSSLMSANSNVNSLMGFQSSQQNLQRHQNPTVVKSLTSSDISDLLS